MDLQPVRQEKRAIVSQQATKAEKKPVPGIVNVKEEARRQKKEVLSREEEAAVVM